MRLDKPTRARLAEDAIRQLQEAQRTRQHYDDLLQACIAAHGDVNGTPTSGCYNPAWPDPLKDELRTLAHNIGVQVDHAHALWRQSGRRRFTLWRIQDQYRKLKDGRISYY